ncbi:carboxyltransferase subunit alpha [Butyrivibrio sp. YAB3001]|uniref:carboxyltransferase subunit alpha n=1 Tax=Butyrivibrio sp. YAB3001 TaxID=1520812 RepID=UPI0008F62FB9|nr:carboxyltransferase subunit alpha [Butyrivibrio sp. YAB3001]SFB96962.1 acetyl-CoA carboxylase carboxyl transferase subunit alpha [Butyrivibrio sp. YAB3001]
MKIDDYDIVLRARMEGRLTAKDYIEGTVSDFMELHGDRLYGDDKAVIGGIGFIEDIPVTVIGIEKGKNTKDRIVHNFGSANPEGYRKALRLMKQAEKFGRPILCFVDTAGAFCGIEAEEHGQGRAIADNLYEMSTLKTPILSIVIGEGGSGGALALSHADRIWMLKDAYFSVVSPENCANILWKDTGKASKAADALSLTADKLYSLGLIDKIVDNSDMKKLSGDIYKEFLKLREQDTTSLLEGRYRKFRKVGY